MPILRKLILVFLMLMFLSAPLEAQTESDMPYLYYYSRMFGGLVIEHPDGTDSRLIGEDVIRPNLYSIAGPGWSPSGRFFAGFGYDRSNEPTPDSTRNPFIIDVQGASKFDWLQNIRRTTSMHWSPDESDFLIIFGSYGLIEGMGAFIWLLDVSNGELLAEFGTNLNYESPRLSEITWDLDHKQVIVDIGPDLYHDDYFRLTMNFNGTVIKEQIGRDEIRRIPRSDVSPFGNERWGPRYWRSPSGLYEIDQRPNVIRNQITGEVSVLPEHTQVRGCRVFQWSADERFIITLRGYDSCGVLISVMGVTDYRGLLWREIGSCSWGEPSCGWLPKQVDLQSLPPGSPEPIQLDPIYIEKYESSETSLMAENYLGLQCHERGTASILDNEMQQTLYELSYSLYCSYPAYIWMPDRTELIVAYDPVNDLLATYCSCLYDRVIVWTRGENNVYKPLLPLNSYGGELMFVQGGRYLSARNGFSWKVYAVEDILEAAARRN